MSGQHSLTPADLFQGFARDGFRLRDPVTDTRGLYHTRAVGACLEPLSFAGDVMCIDRNAVPAHGDIVLFEWPPEVVEEWLASERCAEFVKRWGRPTTNFSRGLKLLWEYPHGAPDWVPKENLLLTNENMTKVRNHKLLGVVRAVIRNGVLLTTLGLAACDNVAPYAAPGTEIPVTPVAMIDPNAATIIIINNNNGAGSGITGITGLSNLGIVVSTAGPVGDATVIVTATIQARQTVGTIGDVKLLLRFTDDTGATHVSSAQETPIMSASFQGFALQWQFAHSHVNTGLTMQASIWSDSGSTSDSYDWQIATLQMEIIRR